MAKKKEKTLREEIKEELNVVKKELINDLKKEFKDEFKEDFKGKKKKDDSEALFIPAGVLTGLGAGFVFGNVPAGLFLGLGAGFILFAIIAVIKSFRK